MKEKRLIDNYKKVLSSLVLLLLVSIVSAQTYYSGSNSFMQGFEKVFNGVVEFLRVLLEPFFGVSTIAGLTTGEVLFIKILFFSLILAVVWSVVDRIGVFGDNTWARVLVAIGASLLSTRILASPGWIETIMLPYSTLGIAISAGIPLIIYFFFIEKGLEGEEYRVLRRASWIFGMVIFAVLYFSRADEIGRIAGGSFNPAWIYLFSTAACLVLFLADGTIQSAFGKARSENITSLHRSKLKLALSGEIEALRKAVYEDNAYPTRRNGKIDDLDYERIYDSLMGRAKAAGMEERMKILPEHT